MIKIADYFNKVPSSVCDPHILTNNYTLGNIITNNSESIIWEKVSLALIGVPYLSVKEETEGKSSSDLIREQLYSLNRIQTSLPIVDLGNLKPGQTARDTLSGLGDIINWLNNKSITVIILGGAQYLMNSLKKINTHTGKKLDITFLDSKLGLKVKEEELEGRFLEDLRFKKKRWIKDLKLIGQQMHFTDTEELAFFHENEYEAIRLGDVKENLKKLEPLIRDSDCLGISINSIKACEAPAQQLVSPNGFNGEDICQISWYAGVSDKITVLGIFDFNPKKDLDNRSAMLLAQVVWYFINGFRQRKNEDPQKYPDQFRQYFVEMEEYELKLNFFESPFSGRWWVKFNFKSDINSIINIKSCSCAEYELFRKNIIPDRFLKYL